MAELERTYRGQRQSLLEQTQGVLRSNRYMWIVYGGRPRALDLFNNTITAEAPLAEEA